MKAIRVDHQGVTEIDAAEEEILSADINWGCLPLTRDHDIWHDDCGLFGDEVVVATIGEHRRVPLPVVVLGVVGERSVDATLTAEQVSAMVRDVERVR